MQHQPGLPRRAASIHGLGRGRHGDLPLMVSLWLDANAAPRQHTPLRQSSPMPPTRSASRNASAWHNPMAYQTGASNQSSRAEHSSSRTAPRAFLAARVSSSQIERKTSQTRIHAVHDTTSFAAAWARMCNRSSRPHSASPCACVARSGFVVPGRKNAVSPLERPNPRSQSSSTCSREFKQVAMLSLGFTHGGPL